MWVPTGQRFNVKFKMDSWLDTYSFDLVDDVSSAGMVSFRSTSAGFLAVVYGGFGRL